jgi:mannitol 2-dehydrogenase
MVGFLPVEPDNTCLIAKMSDPAIRIVSLTVTEGGYYQHPLTGDFDIDHDDIRHDAANPGAPRSAFGAIVAAYSARRAAGHLPFTALSCDNLQGNGDILRRVVVELARLSDPDLADWIDTHAAFPNSMVDCIVPATTAEVLAKAEALGLQDAAPVTHENFRQWVIEDRFSAGRPPLERVGVTLTNDVHSYETMKLRILNGGHQLLANAGEILGVDTIADCMADRDISAFFTKVQRSEIIPQVAAVPGMTPSAYLDLISTRFANPEIRDTTRRVAFDGSSRHAGFLLPTMRERSVAGRDVAGLALAEALWARMCAGTREDGSQIAANDPFWEELVDRAGAASKDPSCWRTQQMYAPLAGDTAFARHFDRWLGMLWSQGCRETLQSYVS